MNYTNELYGWLIDSLFILGVLLIPVGIGFMLIPERLFRLANKLNRWIATDTLLNKINAPIYQERFYYRHNKVIGLGIFLISVACLYMMTIYMEMENISNNLVMMAESAFEEWLFVILYYLLIAAVFLTSIFGVIMTIRPSVFKSLEEWGNRWIDTDESLKVLDRQKDLPDRILPGNPRIFGFAVVIAAVYIIWSTYPSS